MRITHSPGPWKVRNAGPHTNALDVAGPKGEFLAAVKWRKEPENTMRPEREEALANAAIMAAAPAMLAALHQICFATNNGERSLAAQVAVGIIDQIGEGLNDAR